MTAGYRYFGGIDFSGAKEPLSNLWTALGEEVEGRLRILSLRPHAYRADLASYVAGGWRNGDLEGRILWGADFPFGLPPEVCGALGIDTAWTKTLAWVADRPPDEIKAAAGATIRAVRLADSGGALAPLDLRLYRQTLEGLRWIHELREEHEVAFFPQDPREDADCALIEVYPSATVRDLNLPRRRTPGGPGQTRARIAAFKPYLDFADPDVASLTATLEDAWDATIACLTAYLCREDLDQPGRVSGPSLERIRREGWIYRAPAALASP